MLCCATVCLIAERVILILPVACEQAATSNMHGYSVRMDAAFT